MVLQNFDGHYLIGSLFPAFHDLATKQGGGGKKKKKMKRSFSLVRAGRLVEKD